MIHLITLLTATVTNSIRYSIQLLPLTNGTWYSCCDHYFPALVPGSMSTRYGVTVLRDWRYTRVQVQRGTYLLLHYRYSHRLLPGLRAVLTGVPGMSIHTQVQM